MTQSKGAENSFFSVTLYNFQKGGGVGGGGGGGEEGEGAEALSLRGPCIALCRCACILQQLYASPDYNIVEVITDQCSAFDVFKRN